jgi:hypothetical protein
MVEFAKFYVIGLLCLIVNSCVAVHGEAYEINYGWKTDKYIIIIHKCNENVTELPELLSGRNGVITY